MKYNVEDNFTSLSETVTMSKSFKQELIQLTLIVCISLRQKQHLRSLSKKFKEVTRKILNKLKRLQTELS